MKDGGNLTEGQRAKLEQLKSGARPFRAWELEEDLRADYRAKGPAEAERLLDDRLHHAAYCRTARAVAVEKKVGRRRDDTLRTVSPSIGRARVESINNKIKVAAKMGCGFGNADDLAPLLALRCSDAKLRSYRGSKKPKQQKRRGVARSPPRKLPEPLFSFLSRLTIAAYL